MPSFLTTCLVYECDQHILVFLSVPFKFFTDDNEVGIKFFSTGVCITPDLAIKNIQKKLFLKFDEASEYYIINHWCILPLSQFREKCIQWNQQAS